MPENAKVRILLLLTDAYGGEGGIAAFNRRLLTAMCRWQGAEVVAAVPVRADMSKESESLPAGLVYVPPAGRGGRLSFVLRSLRTWSRYRPFDMVCCGHLFLLRTATALKALSGASMIGIIYGIESWTPPRKRSIRILTRHLDRFVSVSDFTRTRFLSWSGLEDSAGTIIPCCVDLDRFRPGTPAPELISRFRLEGKRVLMTLARLDAREHYKGVDETLNALPSLLQRVPNLVYMVAGSGTDLPRLKTKARELGVAEHVRFVGYVPEEAKPEYYRLADAFVMPGRGEGFGIVYLEAMACGIPVLASTVDASREAVRDGQLGFLANPDDLESVRDGILRTLDAPRGKRPAGLECFSEAAFETRVHDFLDLWARPGSQDKTDRQ